jgi:predicted metalloprotease with PDZ domain
MYPEPMRFFARLALSLLVNVSVSSMAQRSLGPQPAPPTPSIEAPQDRIFRGAISLTVDSTDTAHKVFLVHETVPVQASGPIVLLYPQWDTGSHAPTGPIASLAGLVVHAEDRRLDWQRDPVNVFAFHITVPPDVTEVEIDFQYLSPAAPRTGAVVMTPNIVVVPWQNVVLYPAGWFARDIAVDAALKLPDGLHPFTSLETAHSAGNTTIFKTTSLETLADSPVYAGRYSKRLDLSPGAPTTINLDVVADSPASLAISTDQLGHLRTMVDQTLQLFRSHHYEHYDMLVSLSDTLPSSGGLEHLQSSEINLPADYFLNEREHLLEENLMAHEYVHSWNGLFRQPADLWTPNFNTPMRDSLLWMYEGHTEFWATVLAVRSGMLDRQQALDALALNAATVQARVGRSWKSLQDSNNDPIYDAGHPVSWRDWQRREDYYGEGVLLWLDIDTLIRTQTKGRKSLEDFTRTFFALKDGDRVTSTYTFDDIVHTLNRIAPYDWTTFLHNRLNSQVEDGVLEGLTRGGYKLIYTDVPTESYRQSEEESGTVDLSYSIGLSVTKTGSIKTLSWGGPAFAAGLGLNARITKVNGQNFDTQALLSAVRNASTTPLELTFEADGQTHTTPIDYHGTLRYPRLQRTPDTPDLLEVLFAPASANPNP